MTWLLTEEAFLIEQPQEFDVFGQQVFVEPFDDGEVAKQRFVGRGPEPVSQGPPEEAGSDHATADGGAEEPA
jgi:hypothetical protein